MGLDRLGFAIVKRGEGRAGHVCIVSARMVGVQGVEKIRERGGGGRLGWGVGGLSNGLLAEAVDF